MGPKCSCVCRKNGENTYHFPSLNEELKQREEICNDSNLTTTRNFFDFSTKTYTEEVIKSKSKKETLPIKLQKITRGYILRRNYKSFLKQELLDLKENLIEKVMKEFYNGKTAMAEKEFRPFDKEGWKKFYPLSPNGGLKRKLFQTEILLSYLNERCTTLYVGQVDLFNKKNGHGTLICKDGSKYIGHWKENNFTGWGRHIDSNGIINEGPFINGVLIGKGERVVDDVLSYTGEFINGKMHGTGKLVTKEYTYEGEFAFDSKEGKGKIDFASGDKFEGEFKSNVINGNGYYLWVTGHSYKGEYQEGKFHGKGIYMWPDGGYYSGDYVQGLKQGSGEFKWKGGKVFRGPFENGNPHGKGIMINPDGKEGQCEFYNGKLVKKKFNEKT